MTRTPEPWEMILTPSKKPDEEGDYAILGYVAGEKRIIAEVYKSVGRDMIRGHSSPGFIYAPAEDNALLIISAPHLRDVLERFVSAVDNRPAGSDCFNLMMQTADEARIILGQRDPV